MYILLEKDSSKSSLHQKPDINEIFNYFRLRKISLDSGRAWRSSDHYYREDVLGRSPVRQYHLR